MIDDIRARLAAVYKNGRHVDFSAEEVDCILTQYDTAQHRIEELTKQLEQSEFARNNHRTEIDRLAAKNAELTAEVARVTAKYDRAVEDMSGYCDTCAFRNDCAKHDNNDTSAGFTWWTDCEDWQYRGTEDK